MAKDLERFFRCGSISINNFYYPFSIYMDPSAASGKSSLKQEFLNGGVRRKC